MSKLDFFIEDLDKTAKRWLPIMEDAGMPTPIKQDVLGCGSYGCAFGTTDPKVMVKFTTNGDEAAFLNYQKEARFSGIVSVNFVLRLERTGYLIWRERLDMCCESAVESLLKEHEIPHEIFDQRMAQGRKFDAWEATIFENELHANYGSLLRDATREKIQTGCEKIAEVPGLRDLGQGLMDMAEFDLYLSDIHLDNVGRLQNYDQLIVFDAQPTGDLNILNEYPIPEV